MARKERAAQTAASTSQNLYLIQFSYTARGWEALLKADEKGRDRIKAVDPIIKALGGCFPKITIPCADGPVIREKFICFGSHDVVTLIAFPSDTAAAAFGIAISAGGAVTGFKTTRLMSWDDAQGAMQLAATSRPMYQRLLK
jgi:uncharacterized protein with GYD domain